jgi:hypothetical protein
MHLAGRDGVAGPSLFDASASDAVISMYESAYVEAAGARSLAGGPLAGDAQAVRALKTRANAVRKGHLKLVARSDGSRSLFDMQADPREERDVARENPDALASFADVPLSLEPPASEPAEPQSQELAEIEQRLESLGYL